jgi:hypothetical protein
MARNNAAVLALIPFYLIFATAFTGMPTLFLVVMIGTGEFFPIFFLIPFFAVGFGFWIAIFRTFRNLKIIRTVLRHGTESVGYFEQLVGGTSVNDSHFSKIQFSYKDASGMPHITKSLRQYSQREYEAIRAQDSFNIKYLGKHAVIMEGGTGGAPMSRAAQMARTTQNTNQQAADMTLRRCYYCGSKFERNATQCKSCGARR